MFDAMDSRNQYQQFPRILRPKARNIGRKRLAVWAAQRMNMTFNMPTDCGNSSTESLLCRSKIARKTGAGFCHSTISNGSFGRRSQRNWKTSGRE